MNATLASVHLLLQFRAEVNFLQHAGRSPRSFKVSTAITTVPLFALVHHLH